MKRTLIIGVLLVVLAAAFLTSCLRKRNNPPIASDENVSTQEDTPAAISLKGNDSEGSVITFTILTEPAHGSLSGMEPNLVYTPEADFNGTDSFTFKVNDGVFDSNSAAVKITVTPVNDPPVAEDDIIEIKEDMQMVPVNVLGNDTDVDNDQLTVLGAAEGSYGSIVISSDNKTIIYTPNKNYSGSDSFTYTMSDSKGGTDTGTVRIKILPVNDAPVIKSKPETTARVWGTYNYRVEAKDLDSGDELKYSLTTGPEGMAIDSTTGMIQWMPKGSQAGTFDVEVEVHDSAGEPASDTQKFSITVASLDTPLTNTMTVKKVYNGKAEQALAQGNKTANLQESDDTWFEVPGGSSIACVFSDASLPEGATIASMVINIEHFEDRSFPADKLQWKIGTGWPDNPDVWYSINAPIHNGQDKESWDLWEITSIIDTGEKLNSFQLQINNSNNISSLKTSINNIYIIVKWY